MKMNKKTWTILSVGVVVIILLIALAATSKNDDIGQTVDTIQSTNQNNGNNLSGNDTNINTSELKTFDVSGVNFSFTPNVITVKEGNRVRINFRSDGGFHDWVIDEFNASTERVNTGETSLVEFTADKKGTFEFYCSVGQHRQMGMVGKLIVE